MGGRVGSFSSPLPASICYLLIESLIYLLVPYQVGKQKRRGGGGVEHFKIADKKMLFRVHFYSKHCVVSRVLWKISETFVIHLLGKDFLYSAS